MRLGSWLEPGLGVGDPVVAELDDAPQRAVGAAADQNRRMGLLDGLRPGPDRVEVDVLAVVLGLVLGPDRLHRLRPLAHEREPPPRVGAVVLHLLLVPAGADPEQEAAAGEAVEARDLLRGHDRVALDDQADPGADQQALGGGRGGCRATNGSRMWLYSRGSSPPPG